VETYHELDCRASHDPSDGERCLYADVDGDGLSDVIDPISNTLLPASKGRMAGDVYVSRSTQIWSNSLAPEKPIELGTGSYGYTLDFDACRPAENGMGD
jgi:hypothetical protein